ncbi:MAG: peptidoglycan recognition family protein [Sedimentisphaerales bacterium]|nr:peptidoglycan recognition family protein [Sedimentisphaerales bacterium]
MARVIEMFYICMAGGAVFLAGCTCQKECPPQIVGEVVFPVPAPAPATLKVEDANLTASKLGIPVEWLPLNNKEHNWSAIIIHHSATDKGNTAYFDKEHKSRVDDFGGTWIGIGYDFVIGNGTLSGDGEVEPTFRWKQQLVGAHCKTADNWANTYGVGIVLVGNFDYSLPTSRQMESLTKLVRYLQKRYDVPTEDIYGHGSTPGAHATDCPGKLFPMAKFKQQLPSDMSASDNATPQDSNG